MNKIKSLALIVLTGAACSLFAQEAVPAAEIAPGGTVAPKGKKAQQQRPVREPRQMPFAMERLAAEFPAEAAVIEKLKATDPAAAEKQLQNLQRKSENAKRSGMKKTRETAREYKENKDEAKLKELKTLLGAQFDKESALRKTAVANIEKKIAADKAAGKNTADMEKALNRFKRQNGNKEEFINKQIERMTADRKGGGKHQGGRKHQGGGIK